MDDDRRGTSTAWIECKWCGWIEKTTPEFHYHPALSEGTRLFVWLPCDKCGQLARLHFQQEPKPAP